MSLKCLAAVVFAMITGVWCCTGAFLAADRSLHAQTKGLESECCSTAPEGESCPIHGAPVGDGVVMLNPTDTGCASSASAARPSRSLPAIRRREFSGTTWTAPRGS
jgi:hypothetical protein